VLAFAHAKMQACRHHASSDWRDLRVRLVNNSGSQVRKGLTWFRSATWDVDWGDAQVSPWIAPGTRKVVGRVQTTSPASDMRSKVQIRVLSGARDTATFQWSLMPRCP